MSFDDCAPTDRSPVQPVGSTLTPDAGDAFYQPLLTPGEIYDFTMQGKPIEKMEGLHLPFPLPTAEKD